MLRDAFATEFFRHFQSRWNPNPALRHQACKNFEFNRRPLLAARHFLQQLTMPTDHSTSTHYPIGVPPAPPPSAPEMPTVATPSTNDAVPSSAGDPAASRFRNSAGGGERQRLNNLFRARTRNTTTAAASQATAETADENQHAPAPAPAPASNSASAPASASDESARPSAQGSDGSAGVPPPAEPPTTPIDARAAAQAQQLKDQIEMARNNSSSSLDGLSESTRNDLMTQLGGNRNWHHEGVRQADEYAKEMAKQGERWGKI